MMRIQSIFKDISELVIENFAHIQDKRYLISYKADNSPVTEADKFLESLIHDRLSSLLPDLQFVGEETYSQESIKNTGYLAVLDPIDGTENFCSGMKEWGVSLGIWKDGEHLGSMLMMPELNEILVTGDPVIKLKSRITGFSSSFNESIVDGIRDSIEYRVTGCAVYNLMNVIRGTFKEFINPKGAYVWDLLPGLMLALEHDCEVFLDDKPFTGKLLDPTKKYRVYIRNK
jgi:myo-inositol-1(or 4)-monophosphatase